MTPRPTDQEPEMDHASTDSTPDGIDLEQQCDNIKAELDELKSQIEQKCNKIKDDLDKLKGQVQSPEFKELSEEEQRGLKEQEEKYRKELDEIKRKKESDTAEMGEILKELEALEKEVDKFSASFPQTAEKPKSGRGKFTDGVSDARNKSVGWVKENPGRTALGVGTLGIGLLARYLYKKRKAKKESLSTSENGNDGTEKKEKKTFGEKWENFWSSGRGTALKWTGIGGLVYWGVHWAMTGKRGLNGIFDRKKGNDTNHGSHVEQIKSYKEFKEKHKDLFEKYQTVGDTVDELYADIYAAEIDDGYNADVVGMNAIALQQGEEESLTGLVPATMDKSFWSVGSMLSEWGIKRDLLEGDVGKVKEYVKSQAGKALQWAFKWFGINFDNWFANNSEERIKEIKAFFYHQMKVTTFLHVREGMLMQKIAEKQFYTDNVGFSSPSEALKNSEWAKRNVLEHADYKSFRAGNILNAYDILQKYELMDSSMDEDTRTEVEHCDKKRTTLLKEDADKNILDKAKDAITDDKVQPESMKDLNELCQNIGHDLVDIEKLTEETERNWRGKLSNSDESVKQTILKNSILLQMLREMRGQFNSLAEKMQQGALSSEELATFRNLVNSYFVFKKDLLVTKKAYQMIYQKDGSFAVKIAESIATSFGNIMKWSSKLLQKDRKEWASRLVLWWLPVWLITAEGIVLWKGGVRQFLKFNGKLALSPVFLYQGALWTGRKLPIIWGGYNHYVGDYLSLRHLFFDGSNGPDKLLLALKKGEISLEQWAKIVQHSVKFPLSGRGTQATRNSLYSATGNLSQTKKILLNKMYDKTFNTDELDIIVKYYDSRSIRRLVDSVTTSQAKTELVELLKHCDWAGLSPRHQELFLDIIDGPMFSRNVFGRNVLDADNIRHLVDNIGSLDISTFTKKELRKFKLELSKLKGVGAFDDFAKLYDIALSIKPSLPPIDSAVRGHAFLTEIDAIEANLRLKLWSGTTDANLMKARSNQLSEAVHTKNELMLRTSALTDLNNLNDVRKAIKKTKGLWATVEDMLSLVGDMKKIIDHPSLSGVKIDWDNLRSFKSSLSGMDDVLERVAKMIDELKAVKGLSSLPNAMIDSFKTLMKFAKYI